MASTGLFFLSIPPNHPSPSALLISHISRSYPAELLPTFHLDHRLFVDTSSLLPNADTSRRQYTSILTLSQSPGTTYVGTTPPPAKEKTKANTQTTPGEPDKAAAASSDTTAKTALITIQFTQTDPISQLIGTKLQPLWAFRQSLVVDNGTSLALQHGEWIVRIGDLKTPTSRSGQQSTTSSNLRGMLVEVSFVGSSVIGPEHTNSTADADSSIQMNSAVGHDDETLIRGLLDSLLEGTGIQMVNSRALFRRTGAHSETGSKRDMNGNAKSETIPVDRDLARLYMDMLRTTR
ncbi:hypothetical protein ABEF93_003937 [Exophiala dermatitidis]